jgi:hypothetical protein
MSLNRSSPLFGSYVSPSGEVTQLASPGDVYRVFRALLEAMPKAMFFSVKNRPECGTTVRSPHGVEVHFP